jgi:hypothetical protein
MSGAKKKTSSSLLSNPKAVSYGTLKLKTSHEILRSMSWAQGANAYTRGDILL